MREIKFRAWDNEVKRIESWEMLKNCNKDWLIDLIDGVFKDDYELMQFTGLKDKNGKEIYEGDIVKFKVTDLEKDKDNFIITECIFLNGRFSMNEIQRDEKDAVCYYYFEDEIVEVIGNKFENPELLK